MKIESVFDPCQSVAFSYLALVVIVYLHIYHAIFNLHFMSDRWLGSGHGDSAAVTDVKFRPVPWANKAEVVKLSVAERSAVMRAEVIDAVELTAAVNQHYDSIVDLQNLLTRIRGSNRRGQLLGILALALLFIGSISEPRICTDETRIMIVFQ